MGTNSIGGLGNVSFGTGLGPSLPIEATSLNVPLASAFLPEGTLGTVEQLARCIQGYSNIEILLAILLLASQHNSHHRPSHFQIDSGCELFLSTSLCGALPQTHIAPVSGTETQNALTPSAHLNITA
jgi:hypothetical protein